jgi:hypothetical protein
MRVLLLLLLFVGGVGAFLSPPSFQRRDPISKLRSEEWSETTVIMAMKKEKNEPVKKGKNFFTLENFKENPGTLIALPFLLLFGLDLVLNIVVITKKTLEFFLLGQTSAPEPWW